MQTLTSRSTRRRRWARFVGTGATALVGATTIGSVAGAAPTPPNAPGVATGSVAALQASSMEVQNPNTGQTTVSWTTSTKFSKTVSQSVGSLAAGDCVTVTGTQSKSSKTTIAARSIIVQSPSSTGSCTRAGGSTSTGRAFGAGGFRFRNGGNGPGGTRPSFPAGSGQRFPGAFAGPLASIAFASGKVTAVSGSTVSVSGVDLSSGSFRPKASSSKSSKSSRASAPATPKTENLKITTSGTTTVSSTQSAAATDLAVGDCVSAFGPAATNGAVTATTVRITSTGGASCTAGFGGGGFFRGGGFGGGGPGGGGPGGGSA